MHDLQQVGGSITVDNCSASTSLRSSLSNTIDYYIIILNVYVIIWIYYNILHISMIDFSIISPT